MPSSHSFEADRAWRILGIQMTPTRIPKIQFTNVFEKKHTQGQSKKLLDDFICFFFHWKQWVQCWIHRCKSMPRISVFTFWTSASLSRILGMHIHMHTSLHECNWKNHIMLHNYANILLLELQLVNQLLALGQPCQTAAQPAKWYC